LVEELVDGKISSAHSNLDALLLDLDGDTLGAELVDTLALSHEHDLELRSLWVVVDVLSQLLVDDVVLHRDVHSDSLLEVNNVLLKRSNLNLSLLELLEELERNLVALVDLLLHGDDVVSGLIQLHLQLVLVGEQVLDISSQGSILSCQGVVLLLLLQPSALIFLTIVLVVQPVSLVLSDNFFLLQPSALILLPVSLVLSDLFLLEIAVALRLLKPRLEHVILSLEVVHDADLVVEGEASGLQSFNLDVLVLGLDFLPVQLLNDLHLRPLGLGHDERLAFLWRQNGGRWPH
jgi:hypothetical protein